MYYQGVILRMMRMVKSPMKL